MYVARHLSWCAGPSRLYKWRAAWVCPKFSMLFMWLHLNHKIEWNLSTPLRSLLLCTIVHCTFVLHTFVSFRFMVPCATDEAHFNFLFVPSFEQRIMSIYFHAHFLSFQIPHAFLTIDTRNMYGTERKKIEENKTKKKWWWPNDGDWTGKCSKLLRFYSKI